MLNYQRVTAISTSSTPTDLGESRSFAGIAIDGQTHLFWWWFDPCFPWFNHLNPK